MSKSLLTSCPVWGWLALTLVLGTPSIGQEALTNGDFEGAVSTCGNDDECPDGWVLVESRDFEASQALSVADNGPSAPGSLAWDFDRSSGSGSGDETTIQHPLNIDVASYDQIILSLDVKVISHNLSGGGNATPAFEWPARVQIHYVDANDVSQVFRYGWYIDSPGDGRDVDPGSGPHAEFKDLEVPVDTWVPNTMDLLALLPTAKTITNLRIGGSGWLFHSRMDNVSLKCSLSDPLPNGTFEGATAACGNDDTCPDGWTLSESRDFENSQLTVVADNGPSAPGSQAVDFDRSGGGGSGDETGIRQDLSLDVACYERLELALDVKVISHNLSGGGGATPAFEWPVRLEIRYLDANDVSQVYRYGWYVSPPGDGGRVVDPGSGLIAEYRDQLVTADTWVPNTFDLFAELPAVKTITRILVGGAGWDYHGRVDNVILTCDLLPCDLGTVNRGAGPIQETLRIDGSTGTVCVPTDTAFSLSLDVGQEGPDPAFYVLYVWAGSSETPTPLFHDGELIGCFVRPTPLHGSTSALTCIRSPNLPNAVCRNVDERAGLPTAPFTLSVNNGLSSPAEFTLQALVRDFGSAHPVRYSTSNAVVLKIQ